jgi:hypothetical protein
MTLPRGKREHHRISCGGGEIDQPDHVDPAPGLRRANPPIFPESSK